MTALRSAGRPRPAALTGVVVALLAVVISLTPGAMSTSAQTPVGDGAAGAPPSHRSPSAGSPPPGSRAARAERMARPGTLTGHGGPIKALQVDASSGRALTGSFDYALMAWDLSGVVPRRLARLEDHGGAVNAVAFVPGTDHMLAAGDDGVVTLWSLADARPIHRFTGHSAKIVALTVSADGRRAVSASWDRTARIWDLDARAAGPVLSGHTGPVNAVALSADGDRVYTASADGTIGLFSAADGAFVRPLHRHGWGINVLERLPGGERLLFGALNGAVGIVDGTGGDLVAELPAHQRPVLALAAIEKPGLVATAGGDGIIRVLRMADLALVEEYQNTFGPVWAMAFAPGGDAIYYGGLDDFAIRWQITPRRPFEPVESAFPRRFQVTGRTDDPLAEGEVQFARKCSVCHTLTPDGANRAGPTLHGIFGRRIATLPGYPFSEPLKGLDIVWTEETVAQLFELGPDVVTPGSKMPLQKMTVKSQRDALIAFLKVATVPAAEPPDRSASPAPATPGPAAGPLSTPSPAR